MSSSVLFHRRGLRDFVSTSPVRSPRRQALEAAEPESRARHNSPEHVRALADHEPVADRERILSDASADIARAAIAGDAPAIAAERILDVLDRIVPSSGKALALHAGVDDVVEFLAAIGSSAILVGRRVAVAALSDGACPTADLPIRRFRSPATESGGAETGVLIPLEAHERLIGLIRVAQRETAIPEVDVDALARLAPTVALALDVIVLTANERRRRDRERMLAAALAMMEHPVFIVSTEGRILYANEAAIRDYGFGRDELTGMLFEQLRAIAPGSAEQGDLYHALAERGTWSGENVHRRKEGSTFPAQIVWSLIRDDGDHEVGLVVTARDLSEERRVEEHLRQAEKLAALGELVAGVAHEVNNPLTGISAFSQLLLEDELSAEQHESVRLIKREADRAVGVIRDLLVFARKAPAREAVVDLSDLVRRTIRLRSYHLSAAGVDVETDLAEDLPGVKGDDQKLQQVVLNLVANAEHAMEGGGQRLLRLRTWRTSERIVLEVADSGTGMTPDVRAHIFEPFYTTKPEGTGTGLGLSVSYGIVQAHGGTIDVESIPGQGTVFRISFPLAPVTGPTSDRHA